jgi:flagellar basal-body rod protein FlgG
MCCRADSTAPQEAGHVAGGRRSSIPAGLIQVGENSVPSSRTASGAIPTWASRARTGAGKLKSRTSSRASNVDPTRELIEMIRTQRAFEMNSQSIRAADETLRSVAQLRQ